jgi:hypothetical protein
MPFSSMLLKADWRYERTIRGASNMTLDGPATLTEEFDNEEDDDHAANFT